MIDHVFRAYDIRGIYGKEIDEKLFKKIGFAFSCFVDKVSIVACDPRPSSEPLKEAFIKGFLKSGKTIVDVGMTTRGVAMFGGLVERAPVAYISASHLPPEWNGVKFIHHDGLGFSPEEIQTIKSLLNKHGFSDGEIIKKNYKEAYIEHISKHVNGKDIKILLDFGNGAGGSVGRDLFERLGFSVETIYEEPDGNFPNRESEIKDFAYLRELSKEYDIVMAYDGDADRFACFHDGKKLESEIIGCIMLNKLSVMKKPVVITVECSNVIEKWAAKFSLPILRSRVGYPFVIKKMKECGACLGVEKSGHFCIPHILPFDDAFCVSAFFAECFSPNNIPETNTKFEMINFEVGDKKKFKIIEKFREHAQAQYKNIALIDGVRVEQNESWFLLRASNTSPLIRLSLEAPVDVFDDFKEECLRLVKGFIDQPFSD